MLRIPLGSSAMTWAGMGEMFPLERLRSWKKYDMIGHVLWNYKEIDA